MNINPQLLEQHFGQLHMQIVILQQAVTDAQTDSNAAKAELSELKAAQKLNDAQKAVDGS